MTSMPIHRPDKTTFAITLLKHIDDDDSRHFALMDVLNNLVRNTWTPGNDLVIVVRAPTNEEILRMEVATGNA